MIRRNLFIIVVVAGWEAAAVSFGCSQVSASDQTILICWVPYSTTIVVAAVTATIAIVIITVISIAVTVTITIISVHTSIIPTTKRASTAVRVSYPHPPPHQMVPSTPGYPAYWWRMPSQNSDYPSEAHQNNRIEGCRELSTTFE